MLKKKIAVIGSGISGLSAAFFLSNKFDVHLFEKNSNLGGHTRTKLVKESNNYYPIDTGFIVFNETNYPDLVKFFEYLNIRFDNSNMSFGVSNFKPNLEYSGKNIFSLFALPKNIFSLKYLKMLKEIYRFYELCNSIKLKKDL